MAKLNFDIEIISRETIKPSSPTPHHLKIFNLSFYDQLLPVDLYSSLLLFYPFLDHQDRHLSHLKSSLSETLTRFYPLAGRFVQDDELFINCTDDGADFIEARISGRLSDVLKHPDPKSLSRFLPVSKASGRILLVMANFFDCTGIIISVSISHKLADASTLSLFVKGWAATARGVGGMVVPEIGIIASRFPAVHLPAVTGPGPDELLAPVKSCKTTRFVYDSKSIIALRAKATSASTQRPSRVEAVAGHIWLSMMRLRSFALIQTVNLRKRIKPPMSENSFGNLAGFFVAEGNKDDGLEGLIAKLRRGLERVEENYANEKGGEERSLALCENEDEFASLVARGDVDLLKVTSWCRFYLYENADFGWGRPVWTSHHAWDLNNFVVLLDGRDGDGVEAWVTLDEHDMDCLERDEDFLQFASFNPTELVH